MTTTPLATIADALIEFILSLLRDPNGVDEFLEDPEEVLTRAGLADICAADVRAVLPVIVEHPDVAPRPPAPQPPPPPEPRPDPRPEPPPVVKEIVTVANNFHIDNRSTIVDQSVNQSIWAEGDVTQIFDQEAVLAVGDESVASGEDTSIDNSETDIAAGDIAIGNTETTTEIDDSFNDESTTIDVSVDTEAVDSFNDESTEVEIETEIEDSFQSETTTEYSSETDIDTTVENTVILPEPEPEETSAYVAAEIEEIPVEMEIEEQ